MASFTSVLDLPFDPERVFERLTDWPAHARWVPLTTIRLLTSRPGGVGARFVARTGIGPLGFDDVMEITEWDPPRRCAVRKVGRVVTGTAVLEVSAAGDGARVTWFEDVEITPVRLTRPFGRLFALVGRVGFDRALRKMASELAAGR